MLLEHRVPGITTAAYWKHPVVAIVTFDLIGLLPTNHIIAHITVAYRSF